MQTNDSKATDLLLSKAVALHAENLSAKDLDVLKKIGIVIPAPKEKKEKAPKTKNPITTQNKLSFKHTAPPEYYVMNTIVCDCCQSHEIKKGKMKQLDPSERFLRFHEEEIPEGERFKSRRLHRINCNKCFERLTQLSVEELAWKVMKLVDANAKKPTFKEAQ